MIKKIMEGDRHAATLLIRSTEKLVANIVFKMINNYADRKDLMQDIYLKIFRYLPKFRFQSKLSTWVAHISYTTCLDHLQKYRPELIDIPDDDEWLLREIAWQKINRETLDASQLLSVKERSEILEKLSATLPPLYRTLITLFHKEELSIDEIMNITGLPAGTVKNYLFRARKILKERLLDYYSKEHL
ncbi:RNA polymerase sigma factor [Chitinophaga sp. CC14]|uniref:RNA polymerase sigma factor n=1 Tax=Chitinophaga sp. CC14 TaxID=3029199 RepID=UPI003B7ED034